MSGLNAVPDSYQAGRVPERLSVQISLVRGIIVVKPQNIALEADATMVSRYEVIAGYAQMIILGGADPEFDRFHGEAVTA
jgi:hypothetical protein